MMKALGRLICLVASSLPVFGQTQTLYIPQIADGAFWQTTFVLTNTTTNPANVSMSFRSDSGAGNSVIWSPPFLEVNSTASLVLSAGSTMYLHTAGTATILTQGYALITADAGVVASAIFTIRNPGRQDVEGTSIATASATRILVPFDNTAGNVTSVGITNPTGVAQTVSVNFKTANGTVLSGTLPSVPANGHLAFTLPQQFAAIAGQDGLAEFYVTSGTISLLALQFTSSGAFTASPVYFQSGPTVISGGTPGGGTPLPLNGKAFTIVGTTTISGKTLTININGIPNGNQYYFTVDDEPSILSGVDIVLGMNVPLSAAGSTATFQSPAATSIVVSDYTDTTNISNLIIGNMTAATVTITFTSLTSGAGVTGTLNFTVNGSSATNYNVQAPFSGTLSTIDAL